MTGREPKRKVPVLSLPFSDLFCFLGWLVGWLNREMVR